MVLIGVEDNRNSVRRWRPYGSEGLPSPHDRPEVADMRFVDYGPSPHYASRMLLMRIKRARSRTSSFWAIMMNCAEAASVDFQTPSMRLVSVRRGERWSLFRFWADSDHAVASTRALPREREQS